MTLVAIIPFSRRERPAAARLVADVVHAFHPVALTGAGVTMLAGVALSLRYLQGEFGELITSQWGQTLLIKLVAARRSRGDRGLELEGAAAQAGERREHRRR